LPQLNVRDSFTSSRKSPPKPKMASARDGHASVSRAETVMSDLSTRTFQVDFKTDLLKAITDIKSGGKFAFSSKVQPPHKLNDLTVSLEGIGQVPIPLDEPHARQIITKARQAPYGKGSDTIVDTAVRNTWELDPSQFTIGWSEWPKYLEKMCEVAAQEMGVDTIVHAEIYKMLLYEEGAMFRSHTDTEKIPGMFGTLVVSLPSTHTGGEVVLKHNGVNMIHESSKHVMSCASWYSDVHHEVLPVKSGYRWVLTYNLAVDHTLPAPSAALKRAELRPLRHCIRRWLAQDPGLRENQCVYHVLDHEYTEANVSYRAMKGEDRARVSALKQACSGLPVTIFLALMEKEETGDVAFEPDDMYGGRRRGYGGYYDEEEDDEDEDEDEDSYHHIEEVHDTHWRLKTLRDLRGKVVAEKLSIDEQDLLEPGCFDGMVGEEEYEGYMGNWGPSATHWYRLSAFAIVPHDSLVKFLSKSEGSSGSSDPLPQAQINYLAQECLLPGSGKHLINALEDLFEQALRYAKDRGPDQMRSQLPAIQNAFQAALQHQRYQLFEHAMTVLHSILPAELYTWLRQWMINQDGEEVALKRFRSIKKGLSSAMSSSDRFAHKFQSISHLVPLPDNLPAGAPATPLPIMEWTRQMLHNCLDVDRPQDVGPGDGAAMVDQALYFDDPILVLTQRVLPIFEKSLDAPAFRLRVLSQVMKLGIKGILPNPESANLYRTMARLFIASQDFATLRDARAIHESEIKAPRTYLGNVKKTIEKAITHENILNFFTCIYKQSTELDNLPAEFTEMVILQADDFPAPELYTMWLPFLQNLIPFLKANSISFDTPGYRKLFSALILATINKYIGAMPPRPKNWTIPGVNCSCDDCAHVNAFLHHPTQMSARFPVNKQRRHHIHQRLDSAGVGCTHQTSRVGNPHTLVVTKTSRPLDVKRQKWRKRRDEVLERLGQFEPEPLRTLLGDDYAKIEQLRASQGGQTGQANLMQGPVAGEKHGRDDDDPGVIDLTSD
ncbi:hypothetical protein F66182_558, partial [Fusarium sp. NRRL 66182]